MAAHWGRTVRELGNALDAEEFSEWLEYERLYGIADGYFVTGQVCAATLAPWAKGGVDPADFVPYFRTPRPPQSPAETRAIFRAHADAVAARNRNAQPGGA